jgi:signal transduction histidine kinase
MAFQFSLAIVTSFFRVGEIWQRDTVYLFVDARDNPLIWLLFLAALSFMSQLAFLLMLASRTQRHAQIKQRRMERIRARSISLLGQNREISRLLDEQRRLLETLTHEVRQPINNAQAALQGIISDLQPAHVNQNRVLPVAIRVQGILDDITLSLSNAIVGATLVERGEGAKMRDCEIISIAHLALLDCPEGARERIVFDFPANDILLPVDPILLRLALRNLLDNAAKFSPPGTEIIFSISLDEARLGVLIAVTSCVEKSFIFADGMLERGKRGQNAEGKDGSGFGLYIVNEIARIHGQNMVVEAAEPGKVTFGIVLPE